MVFEEAAGITKFKSQKKEALRKLEYTEQNLLRVSDLIREVKRQIGSLQRQAGKARRYIELRNRMRQILSAVFSTRAEMRRIPPARLFPATRKRSEKNMETNELTH